MSIFYGGPEAMPQSDLKEAQDVLRSLSIITAHLETNGTMRLSVIGDNGFGEIMYYPSWIRSKN